jgi:hypothetical protein
VYILRHILLPCNRVLVGEITSVFFGGGGHDVMSQM